MIFVAYQAIDIFNSEQLKAFNHKSIPDIEAFMNTGLPLVSCTKIHPKKEPKIVSDSLEQHPLLPQDGD